MQSKIELIMNELKVTFYLKKNETRVDGTVPILGRIRIGMSMVQFSAKVYVQEKLWDVKSGRAKGKTYRGGRDNGGGWQGMPGPVAAAYPCGDRWIFPPSQHDVSGDEQYLAEDDAHDARAEADDEGLCVEHLGDVPLGSADGAQDADLLRALKHRDIRDDADHNARHDERDGDKRNEHICDSVDDSSNTAHHKSDIIGILYLCKFVLAGVIVRDNVLYNVLILK